MDRAVEEQHLRRAEADIVAARERIERQGALVARLQDHGHDTATARAFLETMHDTLVAMEEHRQTILKELAR
jgi:hypothetical protein